MSQTTTTNPAAASDDALLSELLKDLHGEGVETVITDNDGISAAGGEVIELSADAEGTAAVAGAAIAATDQLLADLAADTATGTIDNGIVPVEAPKKKGGRKGKKKDTAASSAAAAGDEGIGGAAPAAAAEPEAPKEPKPPRATSITHKPGDLLLVKLGAAAPDTLVFDLNHTPEQIEAARVAFINRLNDREAIADKVKEKISMFLLWLGKGGDLNEVLKRSLTVLHAEGKLTSGDKGNLQLNLLSKPYSIGTARSQANQMFMALPELGLTIKTKGEMVPNPDSPLLPMAYSILGLA